MAQTRIFTIGHSTHPINKFIAMLQFFAIETLVDIRTVPQSRYNPQFRQDALSASMQEAGIDYRYFKDLGGLRKGRPDSPNTAWRNGGFRGYADYMQSPEFAAALEDLIDLAMQSSTAIMCAEAVPWRCHRNLVSDALVVHGIAVEHIMDVGKSSPHKLSTLAVVSGTSILYPGTQAELF